MERKKSTVSQKSATKSVDKKPKKLKDVAVELNFVKTLSDVKNDVEMEIVKPPKEMKRSKS